jgi:hypothetical protein
MGDAVVRSGSGRHLCGGLDPSLSTISNLIRATDEQLHRASKIMEYVLLR